MSEESNSEEQMDTNLENDNSGDASSDPKEPSTSEEKLAQQEEKEKENIKRKVDILLKATGDAPIMKTKKWAVESDRTVGSIIAFIKRYMKMDATESLYIYVNQCFAPSPDQIILNLFECFGSDGKLVLHYCKTPAWG